MTAQRPTSPHDVDPTISPYKRRSYNLLVMLSLLALAGIAAYILLENYYKPAATNGDPELARFELDAQVKSLQPVTAALEKYYLARQDWPESLAELDLEPGFLEGLSSLHLGSQGELRFGGSEALGSYQSGTLVLAPQGIPGTSDFTWQCRGDGIVEIYLPDYCQAGAIHGNQISD